MAGSFQAALDWLKRPEIAITLSVISLVLVVITLALVPRYLARLPADYFVREPDASARSAAERLLALGRNALAVVLVLAGLAMLLLPGQGILTLLAGITLLDFPGKRRLVRRLFNRPRIRGALERLRRRAGRPPLRFE